MRVGLALAVVGLGGCDALFSVDHVGPPGDAFDASTSADTSMADAAECVGATLHNEDGDMFVDNCDACPTVLSTQADTDGDGLTDDRDPDLSLSVDGDAIFRASVFKSMTELSNDYDTSGTANSTVSNDRVVLPGGAQIALKVPLIPTQIVANVASFSSVQSSDTIALAANAVSCSVGGAGCSGEAGKMCFSLSAVGLTVSAPSSSLSRITISHDINGLHCTLVAQNGPVTITVNGSFVNSVPFVRMTGPSAKPDSLVDLVDK